MAGEPIITVVGNLTADPELKYINDGTPVASFTVACTPRTQNTQTREWTDGEAMFFRCSVWREYAENVTESLAKGMRVMVTGRLQIRSYDRNDGSRGTSVDIRVDEVAPTLRYATAQVTKTSGGRGGYQGGEASYDAPAGGSAQDGWARPQGGEPQGSAFSAPPPF